MLNRRNFFVAAAAASCAAIMPLPSLAKAFGVAKPERPLSDEHYEQLAMAQIMAGRIAVRVQEQSRLRYNSTSVCPVGVIDPWLIKLDGRRGYTISTRSGYPELEGVQEEQFFSPRMFEVAAFPSWKVGIDTWSIVYKVVSAFVQHENLLHYRLSEVASGELFVGSKVTMNVIPCHPSHKHPDKWHGCIFYEEIGVFRFV